MYNRKKRIFALITGILSIVGSSLALIAIINGIYVGISYNMVQTAVISCLSLPISVVLLVFGILSLKKPKSNYNFLYPTKAIHIILIVFLSVGIALSFYSLLTIIYLSLHLYIEYLLIYVLCSLIPELFIAALVLNILGMKIKIYVPKNKNIDNQFNNDISNNQIIKENDNLNTENDN